MSDRHQASGRPYSKTGSQKRKFRDFVMAYGFQAVTRSDLQASIPVPSDAYQGVKGKKLCPNPVRSGIAHLGVCDMRCAWLNLAEPGP